MIFCIEKELLYKSAFIINEKDLFFGIFSSVPFTSRTRVSADSPEKSYLLFSPRNYKPWEYKNTF